jgi:hypothetical protein
MFVTDLSAYRANAAKLQLLAAKVPTFAIELERARVAARFGHAADARAIAAGIENAARATRRGENSFTLALIYAALGDRARTLTALEEGVHERSLFPLQLRDPQLDLVRDQPRFTTLLARLRMEPSAALDP